MTDFDKFGQGRLSFGGHKPLCVFELDPTPGTAHRTPIDCVTIQALWDEIERQRKRLDELDPPKPEEDPGWNDGWND